MNANTAILRLLKPLKKLVFRLYKLMQELVPNRIVIYAKDVENITGRKERTARKLLKKIRDHFGKEQGEFITVFEFCQFTGLKIEQVQPFLFV